MAESSTLNGAISVKNNMYWKDIPMGGFVTLHSYEGGNRAYQWTEHPPGSVDRNPVSIINWSGQETKEAIEFLDRRSQKSEDEIREILDGGAPITPNELRADLKGDWL